MLGRSVLQCARARVVVRAVTSAPRNANSIKGCERTFMSTGAAVVRPQFAHAKTTLQSSSLLTSTYSRTLFIQTQTTPNALSLKFLPGRDVCPEQPIDFSTPKSALRSPLATALFDIESVKGVYLGPDFVSINIEEGGDWQLIKPAVYGALTDFFASNKPILKEEVKKPVAEDGKPVEEDDEVISMIKELIETRIRPAVQEDGGDIEFHHLNRETGIAYVSMHGSCKGCASSSVTLKNGIENMLMHYIPEINGVEEFKDEVLETVSDNQLKQLESMLDKIRRKNDPKDSANASESNTN